MTSHAATKTRVRSGVIVSWLSTALPMESSSRDGRDRVREERSLSQGATQNATTAPQPAKKRSLIGSADCCLRMQVATSSPAAAKAAPSSKPYTHGFASRRERYHCSTPPALAFFLFLAVLSSESKSALPRSAGLVGVGSGGGALPDEKTLSIRPLELRDHSTVAPMLEHAPLRCRARSPVVAVAEASRRRRLARGSPHRERLVGRGRARACGTLGGARH
mmetsp:Transcript_19798/g.65480  ORF Transcript_19798/g.65480 Transcript_19798/m.65480 type:complete len:220 (-) Transcript_19798:35-694(-)